MTRFTTRTGCRSTRTRATAAGKILDADQRPGLSSWSTWSGPRRCSPRRRRSIDADRGPAAGLSSWSTWSGPRRCSPRRRRSLTTRPAVDRRGPGDTIHHADRLPIDADQGHGRGEDPRRGPAARAVELVNLVRASTLLTTPATIARRGPRTSGRAVELVNLVRTSTLLTTPATIAHHAAGCRSTRTRATAAGKILDADQVTRFTTRTGCRSTRTRATAAGKILDADQRPGLSSWSTWSGPRRCSPRRRRSLDADRGPAAGLSSWSTWSGPRRCSPRRRRSLTTRPAVDRCGPGPRPRDPWRPGPELHGRGLLTISGEMAGGAGVGRPGVAHRGEGGLQTFVRVPGNRMGPSRFSCQVSGVGGQTDVHHRARAVGLVNLVRTSTLLTTPATIAHHAAGCRSTRTRATAAGKILDADQRPGLSGWSTWSGPRRCSPRRRRSLTTRPAVDRRGPGDTIHHADRLPIDADQGHGRGEDPRRHAARAPIDADQVTRFTTRPGRRQPGQALDVATMPATIAHHAAGLSIEADQGHGRGKILDATRPGRRSTRTR